MDKNTATPANAAAAPPIPEATLGRDWRIFAFPRNGDNMFRCEHGHCLSCRECPHGCVDSDDEDRCEHGHSFSGGCTWGCYADEDEGEDKGEDKGEDEDDGGKIERVEYYKYEPSDGGYGEAMCDSEASRCNFRNPGCTHGTCDECVDEAHEYERIDNFHYDRFLEAPKRDPVPGGDQELLRLRALECQESNAQNDRKMMERLAQLDWEMMERLSARWDMVHGREQA